MGDQSADLGSEPSTAKHSSLEKTFVELKSKFPNLEKVPTPADNSLELSLSMPSSEIVGFAEELLPKFNFLMDVAGVDYPEREIRFDVVYHFFNHTENFRIRLKVQVAEGGSVPSLTGVYRSADWFEREAYDLFGIQFSGHPGLRRILCHEDFVGHPLRKDYPADFNQELKTTMEHTHAKDQERLMREQDDYLSDRVWLNIGPAHPATHGTLRFMAVLSGETIEKVDVEIGYLHRCFEKCVKIMITIRLFPIPIA